jgi:hypothetical protein
MEKPMEQLSNEELDAQLQTSDEGETPSPESAPEAKTEEKPAEPPDEVAELRKQNELLQKNLEGLKKVVDRQGNELGKARKALIEKPKAEEFIDDPVAATEKLMEHKKQTEEQANEQVQEYLRHAKATVQKHVPEFDSSINDIAEIMKNDGADEETLESFKKNPLVFTPAVLVNLAHRAKLVKEITKLKEEVASLKKTPSDIVSKINKATNASPVVTAKAGGSPKKATTNAKDIYKMSDEQLNALLEQSEEE